MPSLLVGLFLANLIVTAVAVGVIAKMLEITVERTIDQIVAAQIKLMHPEASLAEVLHARNEILKSISIK